MTYRQFNVAMLAVLGALTAWVWYLYSQTKDGTTEMFACALSGAFVALSAASQVYCRGTEH